MQSCYIPNRTEETILFYSDFYYKSPGQQPCDVACLHAQTHGYWTDFLVIHIAKEGSL